MKHPDYKLLCVAMSPSVGKGPAPQLVHLGYDELTKVHERPVLQLFWAQLKEPTAELKEQMDTRIAQLKEAYAPFAYGGPAVEDHNIYGFLLGVDTVEVRLGH